MNLRFRTILTGIAALAVVSFAPAQQSFNQALQQMKIEQKLGAQVPADATLRNEKGENIKFASLLGKRPVVLLPMFFLCRGICGKEVDSLLKDVAVLKDKKVGKDYDVILLSIDPRETPELAMNKKVSLLKVFNQEGSQEGFHFLTGELKEIRKVTDAVGFGYAYDEKDGRINHPAGMMVLTASGKVSQYIYGADYPPKMVELALDTASQDKLGTKAEVELLGCIMIDPKTGERSLVIENVIRLIAGICAIGIFSWIGVMAFQNRREPLTAAPKDNGGSSPRA
ncbi:MAG: hypothetical protein BGO01_19890 [Armatimonadetes bacterium 55-13]|mgnify:FL=1|nr:MAG: hypothetical protein BGO01_19890 [Armatimonadetes bacterium 55-13]